MVRGKTYFVAQPRLTPYPCGGFKTPGAGMAKPLFSVFQPVHQEIPTGLKQEKVVATSEKVQEGAGNPPLIVEDKPMEASETQKRKIIDDDVLKKMQHPVFKVSKIKKAKIETTVGKGNATSAAGSAASSAPAKKAATARPQPSAYKSEKKFYQF